MNRTVLGTIHVERNSKRQFDAAVLRKSLGQVRFDLKNLGRRLDAFESGPLIRRGRRLGRHGTTRGWRLPVPARARLHVQDHFLAVRRRSSTKTEATFGPAIFALQENSTLNVRVDFC